MRILWMKQGVPFRESSMTIEHELAALSRYETSHLRMKRLEQLVWTRVALNEERVRRRVRSSVLIISIAVAFLSGVIMWAHHTEARSRAPLVDDMELPLPAPIN